MSVGLRELLASELVVELENVAVPLFIERLQQKAPGHCMRVSDLDSDLMIRLCARLRAEIPQTTIVLLGDAQLAAPAELTVTSTKLVELRNPYPDGTLRSPLLVFIPNSVRASAEDSFGVATFEDVVIEGLYERLSEQLLNSLPATIRGAVQESLRRLTDPSDPWKLSTPLAIARFLLTAKVNGNDPDALGASLYELGLVPDFDWLAQPDKAPARLIRNRDCVSRLTWSQRSERGRVQELGLVNRAMRNELGNFLSAVETDDPRAWTRQIVLDRSLWPLSFGKWEFEDGGVDPDSIYIGGVSVELPVIQEDETSEPLNQLVGQKVLTVGANGIRRFSVQFSVSPVPSRVAGLAKFVAQIISKEHGPVGLARGKAAWKSSTDKGTIAFTSLNKVDWEEGWHFIRIVAQTDAGDLIPLVDANGVSIPWSRGSDAEIQANESDLFYVLPNSDAEIEPTQRAIPREASVTHALFQAKFRAILEKRDPGSSSISQVLWTGTRSKGRLSTSETMEVRIGKEGTYQIQVSRTLKSIEQKILSDPRGAVSWRLSLESGIAGESLPESMGWPQGTLADQFLTYREKYFEAVRGEHSEFITQSLPDDGAAEAARDYASAYLSLLEDLSRRAEKSPSSESQQAFSELRKLLAIDCIRVALIDHRGSRRSATLIAPTHPLRALWFATWMKLGLAWCDQSRLCSPESVGPTRETLLRYLSPTNFPSVLPTEAGQVLTAIDSINPFWTVFAPTNEQDLRGLIGEVCSGLGLAEPAIGGALLDGEYLASRVRRYLLQHPYVRTLSINAFNAGRASTIAEMLLCLQRDTVFEHLSYDVCLFVPDPEAPTVGQDLLALLSTEASTTAKEADAFSSPSENPLYPKLRIAIRSTEDFRVAPEAHTSHISMLFDVFPAEEISARRATSSSESPPFVHGLVQDFASEYLEDALSVSWLRIPRHGDPQPIPGAEEFSDLLAALARMLSGGTATVSTGQTGLNLRPVVSLVLEPEDRALLHQVHEVSDWVFTLDRNLGIEFFDHGGRVARPDYLIDHSPEISNTLGHRLVITSRSITELEALLRPALEEFGLSVEGNRAIVFLGQLRSLSGRLAMKLISSPTQRAEALGLALSRLYLEHQGVFENQIVVPLDSHLELYRESKRDGDVLGEEISFRRTDLALFDLNVKERTVICRLVEVKCFAGVSDLSAYNALRADIVEQIQTSERIIQSHFDPKIASVDRADRAFKTRQLSVLLEFYLERAQRYGSISPDAFAEAKSFLRLLDRGYSLEFTRSALIFDFAKSGTEVPETEDGVEFHRIGIDLIRQLVDAAVPSTESTSSSSGSQGGGLGGAGPHSVDEIRRRRERAPSVPTLATAAFLSKERDRTLSEDSLSDPMKSLDVEFEPADEPDRSESSQISTDKIVVPDAAAQPSESNGIKGSPSPRETTSRLKPDSAERPVETAGLSYDVMLGVSSESPQYGLLGDVSGRRVAIDLNHTHTISLFGVQGGGKSYTLGTIAEMASLSIPNINVLPQPLATVIFHYSPTMDYRPEFTTMVGPNEDEAQLRILKDTYGAEPQALSDVVLLAPASKVDERRREYPSIEVAPLKFAAAELQTSHWRFLMGAVGNQATYIRQLNRIMKSLRSELTLEGIRKGIEDSTVPDHLKSMAKMRLELAAEYIDDSACLKNIIRPGRLIIVDLRDEFIEKDEALGLFVVLLQLFADAQYTGSDGVERAFNKLVVFDEAHKYIESPDLVSGLIEVVREMRHKGTSIMVASQDPPSVPISLIELSSQIILHKFNSPAWLKHIQKANAALGSLTPDKMSGLRPGEAYIWSSKATDEAFTKGAIKIRCRPRVTCHGGATRTAVE